MDYKRLSQQERIEARSRAIGSVQAIAGDAPLRSAYNNSQQSEYPAWLRSLIVGLSMIVLACSFVLSAMRLYHIGSRTFSTSIDHDLSATVAGAAIVILSEAAAVLFTIAMSVLGKTEGQKRILFASVVGTAALALSGNFYVALWGHHVTFFTVLEAMLPPLLTLSTAYVLKQLMLDEITARFADEQAYQQALSEWKQASARPEQHPQYLQLYANELWDSILKANARREAAKTWLLGLSSRDKTLVVKGEMSADSWLEGELLLLPQYGEVLDDDFLAGDGKNGIAQ